MKTLRISTFLETANAMLAAPAPTREERLTLCVLIEATLMGAKAYGGFRYLCTDDLALGVTPGLALMHCANGDTRTVFPDDSRRRYMAKGA